MFFHRLISDGKHQFSEYYRITLENDYLFDFSASLLSQISSNWKYTLSAQQLVVESYKFRELNLKHANNHFLSSSQTQYKMNRKHKNCYLNIFKSISEAITSIQFCLNPDYESNFFEIICKT